MNKLRIVADQFASAATDNPTCTAFVAADKKRKVEVMMQTMQVPLACASLLVSAQKGLAGIKPAQVADDLAWNFENSRLIVPDLVDIIQDGELVCLNFGCGGIFVKLTDTARQSLKSFASCW